MRLLITARDVAAALHLVQVARAAARDPRFELHVAVQEPAAEHFAAAGIAATTIALPPAKAADSVEADALRAAARRLLGEVRPDAIIVGLSTPFDAGLDEAVLAEANVPTALYQDFWGEQNLILGRAADTILALDAEAAARNLARFNTPSTIVGSAKHSAFAELDIPAARVRVRQSMGLDAQDRVIGFFGQALHALPGYKRTVEAFLAATGAMAPSVKLMLRPHPRENAAQRLETERLFAAAARSVRPLAAGPVEDALAACDVVVSLFSTCTFDTAYLNRFSPQPVAVPVSLLFDAEIAAYCRQHGNYLEFQHHTLGLVKPVYEETELASMLESAIQPETSRDVWQRAHRHLPDPADAPRRVLDAVASRRASLGAIR